GFKKNAVLRWRPGLETPPASWIARKTYRYWRSLHGPIVRLLEPIIPPFQSQSPKVDGAKRGHMGERMRPGTEQQLFRGVGLFEGADRRVAEQVLQSCDTEGGHLYQRRVDGLSAPCRISRSMANIIEKPGFHLIPSAPP